MGKCIKRWFILERRSLVIIVQEDGCIEVGDRLDHCGARILLLGRIVFG